MVAQISPAVPVGAEQQSSVAEYRTAQTGRDIT